MIDRDWIVQVKKDGHRALLCTHDENLDIFNRYGTSLNSSRKFDWSWLLDVLPPDSLIDGELVGTRQANPPNKIAVWDMPIYKARDLTNVPYGERYALLRKVLLNKNNIEHDGMKLLVLRTLPVKDYLKFWNTLGPEDEGVVFKNPKATLDWDLYKTRKIVQQLKLKIR